MLNLLVLLFYIILYIWILLYSQHQMETRSSKSISQPTAYYSRISATRLVKGPSHMYIRHMILPHLQTKFLLPSSASSPPHLLLSTCLKGKCRLCKWSQLYKMSPTLSIHSTHWWHNKTSSLSCPLRILETLPIL